MNCCAVGDHGMSQDVLLAVNHEHASEFVSTILDASGACFPRPKSLSFYKSGRLSQADVNVPGEIGKQCFSRTYKSLPSQSSQSSLCLIGCTCMCATKEIYRSLQVHAIVLCIGSSSMWF